MELTADIKHETLENNEDLFYQMLTGKTVREKITTSRGDFWVKYPKEKDIELIGVLVARRRLGAPASAFDTVTESSMYKSAALDVIIDEGPKWYESAKKKNPDLSWRDMPDLDFIDEVYGLAYSFRIKVQEQLRGNKGAGAGRVTGGDMDEPMGNNVLPEAASTNK